MRPFSEIPPRQWLYGQHLIRGFLSLTVAPGGVGKSSMLVVEAMAMATGRPLLGDKPHMPLRVWYWNGEDPREEIERRLAGAAIHYGISPADIGDRLMVDSGRDIPINLATESRTGVVIDRWKSDALIDAIKATRVDVLVIDPFVTSHSVPENDTTAMNAVVSELRSIADATGCAIDLVHHTSKAGAMNAGEFGILASRGAGAVIDGVRSARLLERMTAKETARYGVEDEAVTYFRVTQGKPNLALPGRPVWRRMVGVRLGNGRDSWEEGDVVGVCTEWNEPEALAGFSPHDFKKVQDALRDAAKDFKASERADDWIGYRVAEAMGLDVGRGLKKERRSPLQNRARVKARALISRMQEANALVVKEFHDSRNGRPIKVVTLGDPVTGDDFATLT
ncbi:helicase RepA family protein [Maritimibacter sp. 55A14]|uniref:helicase RepA family protein n=1 Tax=Maritimibacter sp. 55A14 TaxID=2174844 RepID=UPI001E474A9A|nr:helicase RepA family protein [Maritimibacter sp. 55A14]